MWIESDLGTKRKAPALSKSKFRQFIHIFFINTISILQILLSFSPKLKKAWEDRKTVRQNVNEMGLSSDPNKTVRIPSSKKTRLQFVKIVNGKHFHFSVFVVINVNIFSSRFHRGKCCWTWTTNWSRHTTKGFRCKGFGGRCDCTASF